MPQSGGLEVEQRSWEGGHPALREGWKPSFPGGALVPGVEGWKPSFPGGALVPGVEGWKPSFPGGALVPGVEGWKPSFPALRAGSPHSQGALQ